MKSRTFLLALPAVVILAAAAPAKAQVPLLAPMSKMKITIEPMAPIGPAIDSDQGGMHGGLRGGFGYYFLDRRFISFGMDAKLGYAVVIMKKSNTYYENTGNWLTTSFGFPLRLGGKVAFTLRPALVVEILNNTVHGYDPTENETWHSEFKGSFALGASAAFGFDFAVTERVSIGFGFELHTLLIPHECTTDWYSGTTPSTHHYDTRTGRITILAFAGVTIGI